MRAITIATSDYLKNARRLVVSFLRHHPESSITVFCEDAAAADRLLARAGCAIVELPEIRHYGVKRAKFAAYRRAVAEGSFLFLDADIIVLDSLAELEDDRCLVAAPDDLAECWFIDDKSHPWKGDPSLAANVYFNSGVMFFPASLGGFVERIERESRVDASYTKYSLEPWLSDNPFLCAYVNKDSIPYRPVDGRVFNWQGLVRDGDSLVTGIGGRIVNRETGIPLRLLHFAGIADIDEFMFKLDDEAVRLISATVADAPFDCLSVVEGDRVGAGNPVPLDARVAFGRAIASRVEPLALPNAPAPRIPNYRTFLSLARASRSSAVVWNGLPCGGAYLDPQEYYWLRSRLRQLSLMSVLEIGAGYTSILLNRFIGHVLSVEAFQGQWLEDARSGGCSVALVPFDHGRRRFDPAGLSAALDAEHLWRPDLLFIDSPAGTANRSGVFEQVTGLTKPRFVMLHDAFRDAEIVYAALDTGRYQLLSHFPSLRGMALLGPVGRNPTKRRLRGEPANTGARRRNFFAEPLPGHPRAQVSRDSFLQRIVLRNTGRSTWRHDNQTPVLLSYHVVSATNEVVRSDNRRTSLPCDVDPGDEIIVDLAVDMPEAGSGELFYYIDLLREGKKWFSWTIPDFVIQRYQFGPPQ